MRRASIVYAGGVLLLAVLLASCSVARSNGGKAGSAGAPASGDIASRHESIYVQSAVVKTGELTTEHIASGTVVPVTQSKVAARVSGIVKSVYHLAGTWVKQDETVVQLDDSQLKLSVASAQASLESAKVNLQKAKAQRSLAQLTLTRDKSLIKKDLIPQSQMDVDSTNAEAADQDYRAAQAAMDQATVQLKQADLNLQYASIRAPFAGQLAAVNVNPGEFVGQNTSVFVLASPQRQIDFKVPPGDAAQLAQGTPLTFAYLGSSFPASVSQAPSTPLGGVVPVVGTLAASTPSLPFGSVGSVSYRLTLAHAVIVPISSVQTSGNRDYVFEIRDGKATKQTIVVIAESGTNAAVSGVSSGERLIVNPPPGLLAGSSVSLTESGSTNG